MSAPLPELQGRHRITRLLYSNAIAFASRLRPSTQWCCSALYLVAHNQREHLGGDEPLCFKQRPCRLHWIPEIYSRDRKSRVFDPKETNRFITSQHSASPANVGRTLSTDQVRRELEDALQLRDLPLAPTVTPRLVETNFGRLGTPPHSCNLSIPQGFLMTAEKSSLLDHSTGCAMPWVRTRYR